MRAITNRLTILFAIICSCFLLNYYPGCPSKINTLTHFYNDGKRFHLKIFIFLPFSLFRSHVYTQLPICSVNFTRAGFFTHLPTPELQTNKSESNENQFCLASTTKYLPKDPITYQCLTINDDQNSFNI